MQFFWTKKFTILYKKIKKYILTTALHVFYTTSGVSAEKINTFKNFFLIEKTQHFYIIKYVFIWGYTCVCKYIQTYVFIWLKRQTQFTLFQNNKKKIFI